MNRCAIAHLFIAGIGVYILLAMITILYCLAERRVISARERPLCPLEVKNPEVDAESARCIESFPDLASASGFFSYIVSTCR